MKFNLDRNTGELSQEAVNAVNAMIERLENRPQTGLDKMRERHMNGNPLADQHYPAEPAEQDMPTHIAQAVKRYEMAYRHLTNLQTQMAEAEQELDKSRLLLADVLRNRLPEVMHYIMSVDAGKPGYQ